MILVLLSKLLIQTLIWTLYVSNIWTHFLFQNIIKGLFCPKSLKRHFRRGTQLFLWLSEAPKYPFLKFGALFTPSYIKIIFYSLLLVWTMCLKLFSINDYHVFSSLYYEHTTLTSFLTSLWVDQHICFENCLFWCISK